MNISDLKNKSVGVLGFGKEGQGILSYLLKYDIKPTLYDLKPFEDWDDTQKLIVKHGGIKVVTGENYLEESLWSEVLFQSPGVKLTKHDLDVLQERNAVLTSQTQWFFEHCPAKIIGVTGTKGKGTTASLIYELLSQSTSYKNSQIYLTGNIGKVQPLEFLDQLNEKDWVVYELSSFQLQYLTYSPHIGVCLMITQDHLDYHDDLAEYHTAKSAIAKYQTPSDFLIYNKDYEPTERIGQLGQGQKLTVSKLDCQDNGALIKANIIDVKTQATQISLDVSNRLLRGDHNLENIAAALTVGAILGISEQELTQTVAIFRGLKHRLEFVGEFNGVKYYNDSISTNIDTTIAALKSFTEPTILLLGGASKHLNYQSLVDFMSHRENLKRLVLIGQTGQEIYEQCQQTTLKGLCSAVFTDFESAVKDAIQVAQEGDIVLLSPASTSFDMFQSYDHRGQVFCKLVKEINE